MVFREAGQSIILSFDRGLAVLKTDGGSEGFESFEVGKLRIAIGAKALEEMGTLSFLSSLEVWHTRDFVFRTLNS